jgi:hypothetical protein
VITGSGHFEDVMNALEGAVSQGEYLVGGSFNAADVYVGSGIGFGMQFGTIEKRPAFDQVFDGGSAELASWTRKIPASWENTGNFVRWVFRAQANASNSSAISTRYSEIPCTSEQGIFCSLTGNEIAPSGNRQGLGKSRFCQVLCGSKGERQPTDVNLYIFRHF